MKMGALSFSVINSRPMQVPTIVIGRCTDSAVIVSTKAVFAGSRKLEDQETLHFPNAIVSREMSRRGC